MLSAGYMLNLLYCIAAVYQSYRIPYLYARSYILHASVYI